MSSEQSPVTRGYEVLRDRLFSIPIQFKILGIVLLIIVFFGIGFGYLVMLHPEWSVEATLAFVISGALGLGLSYVLTKLIVHPIRELKESMENVRDFNLSVRVPVYSSDEIGQLAKSFNRLMIFFQDFQDQLRFQHQTKQGMIEQLYQAREDERLRISRELHDQIGQSLSTVQLHLSQLLQEAGPVKDSSLQSIKTRLEDTIDNVRRLSSELRPSILDEAGIVVALQRYVHNTSEQYDVNVDFQSMGIEKGDTLAEDIEIALYRVVQEAMLNAVRHGDPDQISVLVHRNEDSLRVMVEDDGTGFKPEQIMNDSPESVLGILGMKERVDLIDGTLNLESAPGEGTRVQVNVPVERGDPS